MNWCECALALLRRRTSTAPAATQRTCSTHRPQTEYTASVADSVTLMLGTHAPEADAHLPMTPTAPAGPSNATHTAAEFSKLRADDDGGCLHSTGLLHERVVRQRN